MSLAQPYDDEYPYYEESVTESTWHFRVLDYLFDVLDERYRDRHDVVVSANHFVYWKEGDKDKKKAPDVFVSFGALDEDRKSYKVWEAGPPPQVVFEVTSESSRIEDQGTKRAVYEVLGVEEYYLFNPLGEYIPRKLRGFRREQDLLLPIAAEALYSPRLNVDLRVEGNFLRLFDRPSSRPLGSYREEAEARRQAELLAEEAQKSQAQAQSSRAQAEAARAQAEEERALAEEARAQAQARAAELELLLGQEVQRRLEAERLAAELSNRLSGPDSDAP